MIGAIYWTIIVVTVIVIVVADRKSQRLGAIEVPPHPLDFVRYSEDRADPFIGSEADAKPDTGAGLAGQAPSADVGGGGLSGAVR